MNNNSQLVQQLTTALISLVSAAPVYGEYVCTMYVLVNRISCYEKKKGGKRMTIGTENLQRNRIPDFFIS